ncbi:hypothetical protein GALMADRAFT_138383 [Galerina marginata CBS 339.88]|uniref:Uncharacterized protein n=1 Tax=Galerina marginata (strain CBS 339.88) TaxID=685588 RepID=A0A067TED9_GALM3|nr:hypothetical protein GALMADRAFT_138383 [Galerina marginata CBS 339.88]
MAIASATGLFVLFNTTFTPSSSSPAVNQYTLSPLSPSKMLKSFAIVSVITSVVLAQNSTASASTATSTANPLIPSGISQTCSAFLTALNTDSSLTSCLSTLSSATSAFAPGSASVPSSASVTAALNNLCTDSVTSTCSESLIRSKITAFYTACAAELTTNRVDGVIGIYDVLYTLSPMRTSICSKDDSGSWCVMAATTTTREEVSDAVSGESTLGLAQLLALLYTDSSALKRRDTSAIVPNMTTYHDSNLPFIFLKPSLDATALCTACSRNVLTAYINFESNVPYAPGLVKSELLDTQSDLYSAIQSKCPSGFLSGAVQAAGGLSGGILSSSAISIASSGYQSILALAMGVATLAVSIAF